MVDTEKQSIPNPIESNMRDIRSIIFAKIREIKEVYKDILLKYMKKRIVSFFFAVEKNEKKMGGHIICTL